jgi:hypothetical protein
MKLIQAIGLALALLALLYNIVKCDKGKKSSPLKEIHSEVLPERAALLLVGGDIAGGAAAIAVTNVLMTMWLCSGGFCGVQGRSFAAWWQSTMFLIASDSALAMLQSIVMDIDGASITTVAVGATLGATGGARLTEFCQMVEQVDASTATGQAIKANLELHRGLSYAANTVAPYATKAKNVASEAITGAWNWVSAGFEEAIKNAEARQAAREKELEEL